MAQVSTAFTARTEHLRNHDGRSPSEMLSSLTYFLTDNGCGLREINQDAYNFSLSGTDFVEYVRHGIHVLLEAGAFPLTFDKNLPGGGQWIVQTKYGANHDSIAEGVIADWLATGVEVPEWGEFWFGNEECIRVLNGLPRKAPAS